MILSATTGGIPVSKITSFFIKFLNTLNKFIWKIIIFLSKFIKTEQLENLNSKPDNIRYRQFKVDEQAFIEPFKEVEKLDYKQLVKDKNINPIKRRKIKDVKGTVFCPHCDAPKEYLYDNNGKGKQFECKVCSYIFSTNPNPYKDLIFRCPHCNYELSLYHQRNDFNVYKCTNMKCSYYLDNLNSMNVKDRDNFKKNPTLFKLHYIYRAFNVNALTLTRL